MKFYTFLVFILCSFSGFTQTESTSVLDVMVYDSNTGESLTGYRFMMSGTDGSVIEKVISDSTEQKFILRKEEKYTIQISSDGYISTSYLIDTNINCWSGAAIYSAEYFLEPTLFRCCLGLPEIEFEFNSHEISESASDSLFYFIEFMQNNPDLIIEIKGYISPDEHFTLGLQRASVVKSWLIENGISAERLSIWWNSEEVKEMKTKTQLTSENRLRLQEVQFSIIKF